MKDWKLLAALLVLTILISVLLVLSVEKKAVDVSQDKRIYSLSEDVKLLSARVDELKTVKGEDGKTPIKGVDYTDGINGKDATDKQVQRAVDKYLAANPPKNGLNGSSAYALATTNGYKGTLEQWLSSLSIKGDDARELLIECINDQFMKKYYGDDFWQPTNIKCEYL